MSQKIAQDLHFVSIRAIDEYFFQEVKVCEWAKEKIRESFVCLEELEDLMWDWNELFNSSFSYPYKEVISQDKAMPLILLF